jgi:hypothetical protein
MWLAIFLLSACAAPADTIVFNSGKTFEGKVISYSNGVFDVLVKGTRLQAPAWDVSTVSFSGMVVTSAVPAEASDSLQAAAAKTPLGLLEGRKPPGDAVSCKPAELQARIMDLQDKLVRLEFVRRGNIRQITKDEYCVELYDDSMQPVFAFFGTNAVGYVRSIKDSYAWNEPRKSYTLYGVAFANKRLAELAPEFYVWGNFFVPVGRKAVKKMNNVVEYQW